VNIPVLDPFHNIFHHAVKIGNMIIKPKPAVL